MCSKSSADFFRPWNNEKSELKTGCEDTNVKCEFLDDNTSSSSRASSDSPVTGSLNMLSNFVMNTALNNSKDYYFSNDCEHVNKIDRLKVDNSSCDSGQSVSISPQSAFNMQLSAPYGDFFPCGPTFVQQSQLLYNLAAMHNSQIQDMEEAVKMIQQQDIAAKQIKKLRPKKFRCEHCHVSFSNNGQLKGHIRIHTGERPFKCDDENCGKSFTRNEELTRHKRIHTGVRPHSCVICGKRFGRKDHLKKHTRTHDNRGHFHLTTSLTPFNIAHPVSLLPMPPAPHIISPYIYPLPEHLGF